MQIPKSESKKFSILCTFKGAKARDIRLRVFYRNQTNMVEAKEWKDTVKGIGKDLKETHGNKGEKADQEYD